MYRAFFGEDVSSNKNPEAAVTSLHFSSQKGGDCKLMEVGNEHGKRHYKVTTDDHLKCLPIGQRQFESKLTKVFEFYKLPYYYFPSLLVIRIVFNSFFLF